MKIILAGFLLLSGCAASQMWKCVGDRCWSVKTCYPSVDVKCFVEKRRGDGVLILGSMVQNYPEE